MLSLMYITNKKEIAQIAQSAGVDRIIVDLEIIGKRERQGHLNTVISGHTLDDVKAIRKCVKKSKLLVRSNPIHDDIEKELNTIIEYGADIIMLPYFKGKEEVEKFLKIVDGRVKTCLLFETPEAVELVDDILSLEGIDEVHIGLNDLSIGYGINFMFELLSNGAVEKLCNVFNERGMFYGFGGIASLGKGLLPSEHVISEHYRLGSQMTILSRSFCNSEVMSDLDEIKKIFFDKIEEIRNFEKIVSKADTTFFKNNIESISDIITHINSLNKEI